MERQPISGLGSPLSGLQDKFALFTRLVCQTIVLNLFYMMKKPCIILDSNLGPLDFKSAMLPTEPLRSALCKSYIIERETPKNYFYSLGNTFHIYHIKQFKYLFIWGQ
jgi:hypothetical protein